VKQEQCADEKSSAAQWRKHKGRGRRTLSVEVKIHLASLPWIYRSTGLCSPERTPRTQQLQVKTEDHVWFKDRWMVTSLCDE
jgi:hypothetical protein